MSKQDHAILFDFWQTLVEDQRERQALVRRQELVADFLKEKAVPVPENLSEAFIAGNKRFFEIYHAEQRTATLIERLQWIFEYFDFGFAFDEYKHLVDEFARAGMLLNPQPTKNIAEVLEQLSRDFRLGIVSDTGFTPGWVLRQHLQRHELLKYFSAFSFSDETGAGKPHPRTFQTALELLAVAPENAIHCGDLPDHDIAGANALGITSVLYTGLHRDDFNGHQPDHVISDWRELPPIVAEVFG